MIDHELNSGVFLAIQILTVVGVAICGAGVTLYARQRMTDARSVLSGAAAALAAAVVITMAGVTVGVGEFGAIRLLYMSVVISLPLAAIGVFGARLIGKTAMTQVGLMLTALGLLAAPLGAYVSWIEPQRLTLEHSAVVVSRDRAGKDAIRVGVLADLQADSIGDHESAAVDLLMKQGPDMILIPGDLFQGTEGQWTAARAALGDLLRRLDAPAGVYFVRGNVDTENTMNLLKETRIRVIQNELVNVRVGDRSVTIGGMDQDQLDENVLRALETAPGADDIRILLAHRPDHALNLGDRTRVDLTVAGHTHGGQVVIPGFGPIITHSLVPREVAAGGLHWIGSRAIYVSRGIGMERLEAPPMRFNCTPEVSVITLATSH